MAEVTEGSAVWAREHTGVGWVGHWCARTGTGEGGAACEAVPAALDAVCDVCIAFDAVATGAEPSGEGVADEPGGEGVTGAEPSGEGAADEPGGGGGGDEGLPEVMALTAGALAKCVARAAAVLAACVALFAAALTACAARAAAVLAECATLSEAALTAWAAGAFPAWTGADKDSCGKVTLVETNLVARYAD